MTTYIAILTGDTFRFRDRIKGEGWRWDAERRAWTQPISQETYHAGADKWRHHMVNAIPGIGNRGHGIVLTFLSVD